MVRLALAHQLLRQRANVVFKGNRPAGSAIAMHSGQLAACGGLAALDIDHVVSEAQHLVAELNPSICQRRSISL
jgi:hypothetical protein